MLEGRYGSVDYPTNLPTAMGIVGGKDYTCPDEVQNKRSMTPTTSDSSDVESTEEAGEAGTEDYDGSNADQQ